MAKVKQALEDYKTDPRLLDERGPTKERLGRAEEINRQTGEVRDFYGRGDKTGAYTMRDAPIERAHAKGQITDGQYQALRKFYVHWYRAGMTANYGQGADLNRVFGGDGGFSHLNLSEDGVFHHQRYREAITAAGMIGGAVLTAVVCEERKFEDAGENILGWTNRPQAFAAAMTMVQDRANVLCKLWGIVP
jgi:hypothetical protein